jgi:beta-N-acetylhexosaminidase
MGGILKFKPIEHAAVAAVRAGMDLLEICHSPELILRAYESLIAEAEHSTVFRNLLLTRTRQVSIKRRRLVAAKAPAALSTPQFDALRMRIQRFSETISKVHPAPEAKPE